MTKRDIVGFLFKWSGTLLGFFFFVVFTVTSLVYLIPQAYRAESVILIEGIQAISIRAEPMPGIDMSTVLKTESEVLLSRPVMEAVVEEVRPHEIPGKKGWIGRVVTNVRGGFIDAGLLSAIAPRDGWISTLQDEVKVKPVAGSNLLEVRYSHEDPKLATALVNAVTHAYIAHHLHVYATPGVNQFYQAQADKAKGALDGLSKQLEAYRARFPISDTADTRDGLSRTLADLRERAGRARAEVIELAAAYNDSHVKMQVARAKLASIEAAMRNAEEKMARFEQREGEITKMRSLIDSQRASYLHLVEMGAQAKTTEFANPGTTNVRVVEYATVPPVPNHSRLFFVALSVVGGLVLAVSIAMVREYFDQRVSRIDVAEAVLGLPILGAVPVHRTPFAPSRLWRAS